jgi:hypothetical protein
MSDQGLAFARAFHDEFGRLRALAERALTQVDDRQFVAALDGDSNTIAALVKHIGGNLRSRWEDFRTTDGEKADRHRDGEFDAHESRDQIMAVWHHGWETLEASLSSIGEADLDGLLIIRGESVSLPQALARSLAHTAGHVHQLILLARHWAGPGWETLSIPRGQSEQFRQKMLRRSGGAA